MASLNLLYAKVYNIPYSQDESIGIIIPTVGEILDHQEEYYSLVDSLTAMPINMMVQLEDAGIDFTAINEYELFILMFEAIKQMDSSLVFSNIDLKNFEPCVNQETGEVVLLDIEHDIKIDRAMHARIAATLRALHHIKKDNRRPANAEAKRYILDKARRKARRRKNQNASSQLESLIIAMVNTEQFKYDFEGTRELSIYQFNESVRQIINKVDYDNRMFGVYSGTIKASDLNPDDLNWLVHK